MTPRRILASSALLAAAVACEPKVAQQPPPGPIVTALFDPTRSEIPQPNDLLLLDPSSLAASGVPAAQIELLTAFKNQGGFPSDQEVPVSISFARNTVAADGTVTRSGPPLNLTTLTPSTFFVWGITAAGQGEVPVEFEPADYAISTSTGTATLTVHHKGHQPWAPGEYFVFLRGGPNGVKTPAGEPVWASDVFFLVAQGKDMTARENLSLLVAKASATQPDPALALQEALATAQQLNALQAAWAPAFAAADARFPHQELAVLTTFAIAPRATQVDLDPGRGLVPLPIDLLRDPRPVDPSGACPACGKITPLAACTLAGGTFDAAAGSCSTAASGGFKALDGFSTTAPILAPTNDLVLASTVTPATLKLYDLTNPAAPALVDPASYITEPCEFASSGLSPVIAVQPAGVTACDAGPVPAMFRTRPLKENTHYAVVVSDGVKDKTGAAVRPGTVARILMFANPLVAVPPGAAAPVSQLVGIDDATAYALETMRLALKPVLIQAAADGVAQGHVAMAYTFKTQSFLQQAAQLGALPYTRPAAGALPGAVTALTPAQAFTKYGVDPGRVPSGNIDEVLETDITTYDLISPFTGAFDPNGITVDTPIHVLVATPKAAAVPACQGPLAPFGRCSPMMIFRHGLGRGRADMLTVADGFTAQGLTVVAIDAPWHGDRAHCAAGDTTIAVTPTLTVPVCADPAEACLSLLPPGAQGDAKPPGKCAASGFNKYPVSQSCIGNPACAGETDGIPFVSASFYVSGNLFRTRDGSRQDIIDQSQLVRALAFAPSGPPPTGHSVLDHMVGRGVIIDPAAIYYSGQSLGSLQGTADVAANPRIRKAVLNVGGGTAVDILTNSPAFKDQTAALLLGLGIQSGTSAYLQFLAVAKMVLDPADPVNYAGHLLDPATTLPNLLPPLGGNPDGSVPQAPKQVLTQVALCDQVVPNAFNYVWASTLGSSPLPGFPGFGGPGTFQLFWTGTTAPTPTEVADAIAACAVPGGTSAHAVNHGFLTDWSDPLMTGQAQGDAAAFVASDTHPASFVVLP